MLDSLGLCVFGFAPRGVMPIHTLIECVRAVTGWNASLYELMKAAERSSILARAFNSREGISPRDDRIPGRIFDPKPNGPQAGERIFSREEFQQAVDFYYTIVGCDPKTGRPFPGKMAELDLEWAEARMTSAPGKD
jgi:aldehyde:ferredoxin oxidoreductase